MKADVHKALNVIATVLVIAASVAVLWTIFVAHPIEPSGRDDISGTDVIEDLSNRRIRIGLDKAADVRRNSSRTVMIEFSDFQCPFCGKYARESFPLITREYVDSGRIMYAFFDFPLKTIHVDAERAAV